MKTGSKILSLFLPLLSVIPFVNAAAQGLSGSRNSPDPDVLAASAAAANDTQLHYPLTKTTDASDTYFGKVYHDPYRWLEDLKNPDVEAWFKAQGTLTDGLIDKIPGRDALVQEWLALDKLKPAAYGDITYEAGRVFYKKTLASENVGKLYYREGWDGAEKLLFDPGTYKEGVVTTIQSFDPSWDAKLLTLGLSSGGAEWSEIRVLDVDNGKLLPESIYPSYGAGGWMKDNKSFFYDAGKVTDIKSEEIELNRKTRIHTIGADIASDPDILSDENNPELKIAPQEMPSASIDESYPDYIFGNVSTVQNEMRIYYAPAPEQAGEKIKWQRSSAKSRTTWCAASNSTAIMPMPSPIPARRATSLCEQVLNIPTGTTRRPSSRSRRTRSSRSRRARITCW